MSKSKQVTTNDEQSISATCNDCNWEYERSPTDTLSHEENTNIALRVIRSHAFKCGCDGHENRWGENLADIDIDAPGGVLDASM